MSSLTRRIEIRALKKRNFIRTKYQLVRNPVTKAIDQVPVRRGGLILDSDNEPVGYRWPKIPPKQAA